MKKQKNSLIRVLSVTTLVATAAFQVLLPVSSVSAAQITNRSLTLQAGATDGGSKPGGVVNHFYQFTIPSTTTLGSITFKYCTTAAAVVGGLDCNTPVGLVTTSAILGSESGATGFTGINKTTNGTVTINRTAAAAPAGNVPVSYQLQSVTNPTTTNETFHVRISTFSSLDGTGTAIDTGTVTASTATPIALSGTMPESLVFCTGRTVTVNGSGVVDCATATDGAVSFNQLFSPTDTATATSQMAASTNAGAGYAITVNGTTLTSGSNTITALATPTAIVRGTSQFGINLKANTIATSNPAVGAEAAPVANGTNYKGQATTDYGTVDSFKYISGDAVAMSNNAGAGGTDSQIFTASYIVNVPGNQPAGTYTSTLTYICTPTF